MKITVNRPGAEAVARPGYAIAAEEFVPISPEERKLLAGFDAAAAAPAPADVHRAEPVQDAEGRYVVPLSMEILPGALKVEQKVGQREMQLEVLGLVRESQATILSRLGGFFDIRLDDKQFEAVVNNNIFLPTGHRAGPRHLARSS